METRQGNIWRILQANSVQDWKVLSFHLLRVGCHSFYWIPYFCLWQKTINSCQETFKCSSLFRILLIVLYFCCSVKESVTRFVRETSCCWFFSPCLWNFFPRSLRAVTMTRKLCHWYTWYWDNNFCMFHPDLCNSWLFKDYLVPDHQQWLSDF